MWEPKPEEIVRLYTTLDKKGIIELEWNCPGRRSPSVHSGDSESLERKPLHADDEHTKRLEPNEFDFDEIGGEVSAPKITPRRRVLPHNSAQKRVARLDKVMFDIHRFQRMDEIEKKTQKISFSNSAAGHNNNASNES